MWRVSTVEVWWKTKKEAKMISEGHIEMVMTAWQEKAKTQEAQETRSQSVTDC